MESSWPGLGEGCKWGEISPPLNLGGGFKHFLFSPRKLGKISNLTSIFFKGVETTNQKWLELTNCGFSVDLKFLCKVGPYYSYKWGEINNAYINISYILPELAW